MPYILGGTEPDYAKLECKKCGNKKTFKEFALTETEQSFEIKKGDPDFDASSPIDAPNSPQAIVCGECAGLVWEVEEVKE